jgi:hypothetical protein
MKTIHETGQAKNVANFSTLISRCQGYGLRYNPTNNLIKLPNLINVKNSAAAALVTVNSSKSVFIDAVNARAPLFQSMEKLSTRAKNALAATENVDDSTVIDAMTFIRKIRGARKDKKILNPKPEDPKQISASQQSYDQQVEHFNKLVSLLTSVTAYNPNETELKPSSLHTFELQLRTANDTVVSSATSMLNAIQGRNVILYAPKTGLVDLAYEAKKYVKSVSTILLEEYRQISGLKFRRPPKKR